MAKTVKKTVKSDPKTPKPAAKKPVSKEKDKDAQLALRKKKIQEHNALNLDMDKEDEELQGYKLPIIGRTRFSDEELNEFKVLIHSKIAESREELDFFNEQMKDSEMNDDDIKFSGMEDGGHTNDKEQLSAMSNRQIKFIQNLEAALVRIENKTYGICRMTGDLIDKKRLMAVPHATLSMKAKTGKV
jgi:DnaK suppressor protein